MSELCCYVLLNFWRRSPAIYPWNPEELGTSDWKVETETVVHYESQHQSHWYTLNKNKVLRITLALPWSVFLAISRFRGGGIRWDAAGYSWIQLDTYGYSWIQWDTAGYSGSAAKLLDVDRYRDTAGYQGYGEIQAEYRLNTGGTSQTYTPGEGLLWRAGHL